MNRIIKELKDVYDTFQKAEFVFDDPTTEGQLYLCHHKLKQVIKTLEAREQFYNKEDKKIKHINKVYDITNFRKEYPIVAEMLKDLSNKQYEIIDRLNGESDE